MTGRGLRRRLCRWVGWLCDAEMAIAQLAMVAMMLAIAADVASRALWNAPIRGTYDAVGILLCLTALFSFGRVILDHREIVIDLIDMAVPERVSLTLRRLWSALAVLVLGYILWAMVKPMLEARMYGDVSLELGLPVWWIWALALAGLGGAWAAALCAVLAPPEPGDGPDALRESGE